ncbi:hypothetical protein L207DRAFT_582311 [Hyaloscypha variabilis F]|uniref:Cupredoxin n=1 Tax=Hyaloscypha variabilis (strain UAMH 11265 / GT02V1 / F) TaxID=1149755 RepID=A0A2J6RTP7_HYAVF|nr:hypothetical protein L207DRAFT_582311 [Hyaloscypha variabilis F]
MFLNIAVVFSTVLLSSSLVFADGPTSTSTAAAGATHIVAAGVDGFNFLPQETYANVGDVIEFQFYPLNHSVVRASYGNEPCVPYEYTTPGQLGFYSGFMPVNQALSNPPSFQVTINDTAPIFFYCSQTDACFQGMVGVINPNATQTFKSQMAYALNATVEFSPEQTFLPEALPTTSFSRTTTYTGATAPPTVAPATTTSAVPLPTKSSSLPTGAIIGIAIGGVALLALAAALLYMCGRQKTVKDMLRQSQPPPNHNSYQPQPSSPGFSEANYANIQKEPNMAVSQDLHHSAQSFAPPTERSMSPPVDEHSGMMGMHPLHAGARGYSPGFMSPGLISPDTPGYPSPVYTDSLRHEIGGLQGVRPYNPNETGPHELAVPTPHTSPQEQNEHRPFSYTDSESGYTRPEKSESDTY